MEYFCKICNKKYVSYKSLWNHNSKFHKENVITKCIPNENMLPKCNQKNENINNCTICNKLLSNRHSRWRHEQICKKKIEENKNKMNKMKEEIKKEIENEMNFLKEELKTLKNTPKNINNGTIINNNNYIIPLYQQNLKEVLKMSDKLDIMNSGSQAHVKLTNIIYKNPEYEKFRDVYITNMTNDIGYMYDGKEKRYIVKTKKDILNDYGHERFSDIELLYLELADKIPSKKLDKMKEMVKNYFNNEKFKESKHKEMLISLYNNKINVKKIPNIISDNLKEIEI